ncbi:unnamed protein product [Ilex paraguariensis]|uniref:Uncharacterized protein n=1 Tax=Ilex paraguariensis TaxID=185542 RepID=A0ABC8T1T3_9AQUA
MAAVDIPDYAYFEPLEHSLDYGPYRENVQLVTKGRESEYSSILRMVRSIDLSSNNLFGSIPAEIFDLSRLRLTSLNCLNLAYNHLSGRIPSSIQLQSLNETGFIGNAGLCGAPLPINCSEDDEFQGSTPVHKNWDEFEMFWFYIGMGMGFSTGFWGVCVVLFFKRSWRHAYFKFLDELKDRIYVAQLLKMNWFRVKFNDV